MAGAHFIPLLPPKLVMDMVISFRNMIVVVLTMSEGEKNIWGKYNVWKLIKKAKTMIWEWIKYRINSYEDMLVYFGRLLLT